MILAVTGSRTWEDEITLQAILGAHLIGLKDEHLHVGDARGADAMAVRFAKLRGIPHTVYEAEWRALGLAAGMIRNRRMLDEGKPELLIAFRWGPASKGTDGCIHEARIRKIPTMIVQHG